MSPPQLSGDAPVFDVLHPVAVGVFVFGGIEFYLVVHYRLQCDLGEMFHFEKPLHREFRLDDDIGTLGISHFIVIVFDFFEQSCFFEVYGDLFPHVETVLTYIHAAGFTDCSVVVENIDDGQIIFFAQHIVVYVVGRGNFQAARSEFDVYIVVHNDGYGTAYQRNDDPFPFEIAVTRVVGIDAYSGITENRLRTCRGDNDIFIGLTLDHVAEVVELAVFFFIDHLFVRECRESLRVPVYHAYTAVDKSLVEEVDKYFDDTAAAGLVHRKGCAVPVARSPQPA